MPRIRNLAWRIAVSSASPLRARRHLAHLVARTQRRERPDEGRGCPVVDVACAQLAETVLAPGQQIMEYP